MNICGTSPMVIFCYPIVILTKDSTLINQNVETLVEKILNLYVKSGTDPEVMPSRLRGHPGSDPTCIGFNDCNGYFETFLVENPHYIEVIYQKMQNHQTIILILLSGS